MSFNTILSIIFSFLFYVGLRVTKTYLNGSLNNKVNKIRYDDSNNGREISYLGSAFIVVYQGGALGAAIYFVNSTEYVFQYTKISDTLTDYPVTFSSVDKNTGTFNIAWDIANYAVLLVPLV
nr:MAG TPA: hypothetical protein [Caudoviricetes sp.]